MRMTSELGTERLRLRAWQERDLAPFAALNADARVMQYFPAALSAAQSDALAERIRDHFERHGFGLWALEAPGVAEFIGFLGLSVPSFEAHFTPCVEIAWRIASEHWGAGYATEGARAALELAFGDLLLTEVVSFTVPANQRSRRVMEKIGMRRDASDDFEHPSLPAGHSLEPHVLYRIRPGA